MIRFRPGLWPTIAAIAVVIATVSLGDWQYGRASYKADLQAQAASASRETPLVLRGARDVDASMRYRKVSAAGTYMANAQIWLDNRTHKGASGYYVLTPLRLDDGTHVLVNRGWIAATKLRDVVPPAPSPADPVVVTGRLNTAPGSFLALSNVNVSGAVWQNVDLADYARVQKIDVAPLIIEAAGAASDGLIRSWPMPDFGRDTNIGYMYQWYGFGGLTLVLWIVLGFRAGRTTIGKHNGK